MTTQTNRMDYHDIVVEYENTYTIKYLQIYILYRYIALVVYTKITQDGVSCM